tara:strand:- start:103 stop:378 length:276 start_codon:yes stop_codon:yes gene_type:complete
VKLGPRCQKRTIVHAVFRQQEQVEQLGHRLRERTIVQNAPRQQGRVWLELVISCVNEQLFVIPNNSRPDTADAAGMTRAQGEQLFRTRQAA